MLSDLLRPRVCELGKIKIGGKGDSRKTSDGQGSYRMPVKYDHFVITTMNRTRDDDLIQDSELMAALSEYADQDGKLRSLPVAVLSNDIEDIVQASWVWYIGKRIAGRCEGETATLFYDAKNRQWLNQPIEVPWDPDWAKPIDDKGTRLWKLHTTLNVVLATKQARWGGVYKFRTTSQITGDQLYGSLLQLKALTGGILRGLPLCMVVRPMQVSPQGKTTTVYVVHLELRGPDFDAIQRLAIERAKFELANASQLQQARIEYRRLLRSPGEGESEVEQADIADEFHTDVEDEPKPPPGPDPLADQLGLNGHAETTGSPQETKAAEPETAAEKPPVTAEEPTKTADAPHKSPLSEQLQKCILTELHRLQRAWHDDSCRKWCSEQICRTIEPGSHVSTLSEDEARVLLDKLVNMSPKKPVRNKQTAAST